MTQWSSEADFFTACNCDWGCPCNFNARPTSNVLLWLASRIYRQGILAPLWRKELR